MAGQGSAAPGITAATVTVAVQGVTRNTRTKGRQEPTVAVDGRQGGFPQRPGSNGQTECLGLHGHRLAVGTHGRACIRGSPHLECRHDGERIHLM
jgi:hypothetical protein